MENIRRGEFEQRCRKARELFLLRKRYEVIEEGVERLAEQLEFFSEILRLFMFHGYSSEFEMKEPGRLSAEGAQFHVEKQGGAWRRREKIAEFIRSGSALLDFGLLELSIQRRKDIFPEQDNIVYLFDFSFMVTFRNTLRDKEIIVKLRELGEKFCFSLEFLEGFSFLLIRRKEVGHGKWSS